MKLFALLILSIALVGGCSKDRSDDKKQVSQAEPDNTGRNTRDRDNQTKTSGDQSENEADRKITQQIRAALTSDDSLSTNAKNVKVITNDGTVTLRGPVKSDKEKTQVEAKAKQVTGVKRVENELEVAS